MQLIKLDPENYIIEQVVTWTSGTLFQGLRLLSAPFDKAKWEEDFFIFAAYRVVNFLGILKKQYDGFDQILKRINKKVNVEIIEDLRHMRFHVEDFLAGKGRHGRQPRYIHKRENVVVKGLLPQNIGTVEASAMNSFITNNEYRIGDRLVVQDVLKIFSEIMPDLVSLYHKHKVSVDIKKRADELNKKTNA